MTRRPLEPIPPATVDRLVICVAIVAFCILFAVLSHLGNPEPALPHCPPPRDIATTTVRCQP